MSEEFVGRNEFEQLKAEVKEIKLEVAESSKLLQMIDKKLDIINEKVITADKIDDLKLTPLEKRVSSLEDTQKWLRRTIFGGIITIIVGAIVFVVKMM